MAGFVGGKGERKEEIARASAHRGNVTCCASKASIANGCRRRGVIAKVHVFEAEVATDDPFRLRREAKNGGIIANAKAQAGAISERFHRTSLFCKPLDQLSFPVLQASCFWHRRSSINAVKRVLCLPDYKGDPEAM